MNLPDLLLTQANVRYVVYSLLTLHFLRDKPIVIDTCKTAYKLGVYQAKNRVRFRLIIKR